MGFYFISLGTNLDHSLNMRRMLMELWTLSPRLDVSRIAATEPVGGTFRHVFWNAVVRLSFAGDACELKRQLNAIETRLGRDRTDPCRKKKDRPADLDILLHVAPSCESIVSDRIPTEPYVRPYFLELARYLGYRASPVSPLVTDDGLMVRVEQWQLGRAPLTIDRGRLK